jgi:hypothetical protein
VLNFLANFSRTFGGKLLFFVEIRREKLREIFRIFLMIDEKLFEEVVGEVVMRKMAYLGMELADFESSNRFGILIKFY